MTGLAVFYRSYTPPKPLGDFVERFWLCSDAPPHSRERTRPGPAFASISNGNLTLWLSGPESSGSRPMPDGRRQEPGGWNRLVLQVDRPGSQS